MTAAKTGNQPPEEAFKSFFRALEATRKQLAEHKGALFDCLRDAKGRHPKDKVWHDLVLIAHLHKRRETATPVPDFICNRAGKIEKQLRKSLALVEWTKEKAGRYIEELAIDFVMPDIKDFLFDSEMEKMFTRLIGASEQIAKLKRRNRPGRQVQRPISPDCIYELARVFSDCTGKQPTTTERGPFAEFVHAFCEATNRGREFSTVVNDLKSARKQNVTAFKG